MCAARPEFRSSACFKLSSEELVQSSNDFVKIWTVFDFDGFSKTDSRVVITGSSSFSFVTNRVDRRGRFFKMFIFDLSLYTDVELSSDDELKLWFILAVAGEISPASINSSRMSVLSEFTFILDLKGFDKLAGTSLLLLQSEFVLVNILVQFRCLQSVQAFFLLVKFVSNVKESD